MSNLPSFDNIKLNVTNDREYPYRKLASSFILPWAIRKTASLIKIVDKQTQQKFNDGTHTKRRMDIVDQETFRTLAAELNFLYKGLIRFPSELDEKGLYNITESIKKVNIALSRFSMDGTQPIRSFIARLEKLVLQLPEFEEVVGYYIADADDRNTSRLVYQSVFEAKRIKKPNEHIVKAYCRYCSDAQAGDVRSHKVSKGIYSIHSNDVCFTR